MIKERAKLGQQIKDLIQHRGNDYFRAVNEVKNIIESYRGSIEGKNAIYDIKSRGNYQNGDELKLPESIFRKIIARKSKVSNYSIKNVEDMIGIRIICIYPSDVESVKNYIAKKEHRLHLFSGPDLITRPSGYRAVHITVGINEPPELRDLKCEIQIVTMLQEAWSFKSHDMVYKSEGKIEKELETLTSCLSDFLTAVDKQSEQIKIQIEKKQKTEEQRRANLIRDHQMNLLSDGTILDENFMKYYTKKSIHFEGIEDPNIGMQLLKHLVKDMSIEELKEEDFDNIIEHLHAYEENFKIFESEKNFDLCKELCRVFLLVALMERTGKFRARALGYSDKLIWQFDGNCVNEAKAHLFKGRVLSALKRYNEALEETDKVIDVAELSNLAKNDWAYFATEYIDEQRRLVESNLTTIEIEALTKKAFGLAQQAVDDEPDGIRKLQFEDTLGFVKIILGKTPEEIKEGLELCRRALQADPRQELANLYLWRHESIAYQRLLSILND